MVDELGAVAKEDFCAGNYIPYATNTTREAGSKTRVLEVYLCPRAFRNTAGA